MTATLLVPVIAAALLVAGEAIAGPRRDPAWLGAAAFGAVVVSIVVLLTATIAVGRSVALTVAGMAAAVAAVWLVRYLARR